jgi:hypothetical protein
LIVPTLKVDWLEVGILQSVKVLQVRAAAWSAFVRHFRSEIEPRIIERQGVQLETAE